MSDQTNDIKKYIKGELSPKEMHALEKRALTDPFLADAIEGGMSVSRKEFSKDVEELNKKIFKEETIIFTPLRIAAGIVLLIGAGMFLLWPTNESKGVALNKIDSAKTETQNETLAAPPVAEQEKPSAKTQIKRQTSPKTSEPAPVVTSVLEPEKTTEAPTVVKVEPAPVETSANPTHTISGTVTTAEDNLPLPGVTVVMKGTTRGTTTDINGNYSLDVVDTASLEFSFVGMKTSDVAANDKSTLDVKMNEDVSQLSEVVIARTALPTEQESHEPVVRLAEPVGGLRAYDKYLKGQRQYPQQALDNDVKGRVIVGFDVDRDGSLTNFKVIRSLGSGCDEELMRLVKDGPSWHPTTEDNKPVESTVHVKMKFDAAKFKKGKK